MATAVSTPLDWPHVFTSAQLHSAASTGIPQLSAGVSWDSKRSLLLLALRQAGSKAVMQGAVKASEPVVLGGENTGGAAPGGRACTLKVLVRELDACEEHPLQVR